LVVSPLYVKGNSKKLMIKFIPLACSPDVVHRDSVAAMNRRIDAKKPLIWLLIAALAVPAPVAFAQQSMGPGIVQPPAAKPSTNDGKAQIVAAQANQATIRVTRKATDEYAVNSLGNGTIVIKTRYCHEYVRNEEALLQTREDGAENALLFATGAYCDVVGVTKADDRSYGLLDFLVDLGLMLLNKATRGLTPIPMPKRN
jgi:hypothetical protein